MMEMASWDGGISRTVQFLVPKVRSQCPGCVCVFLSIYSALAKLPFKSLLASKSALKEMRIQCVHSTDKKAHLPLL